ncbi:MAG: fumarylacetoacetate hydrolase family protein [Lachnospiraceae bacterium]|jgi:2-keto-4-pentenoate hydratase/2-oxohepta-3-ene-1,7-dioic acid hydratase in catechol pathway|nr:fumarylacetoacetate hydrolase family protein [Lachnospiraceae bacterium]
MKLVTYRIDQKQKVGVLSVDGEWVYPICNAGIDYGTMLELIKNVSEPELQLLEIASKKQPQDIQDPVKKAQVHILAPIPHPEQDILCLGQNYADHAKESARYKKELFPTENKFPVYFSKRVWEATADGDPIPSHPSVTEKLDYEAELAVILWKDATNVSPEEAKDYVLGYTVLNDVSARDVQERHKQWYMAKSLDGFCPMGPCIATRDDFAYPPELPVRSYVNGELRQDGNTASFIFSLDYVISELSKGMTLRAGTIISTGTPAGVGMGFDPPKFLKPGDVVECEVEGVGKITNRVE